MVTQKCEGQNHLPAAATVHPCL